MAHNIECILKSNNSFRKILFKDKSEQEGRGIDLLQNGVSSKYLFHHRLLLPSSHF